MDRVRSDLFLRPDTRPVVLAHAFVGGGVPSESERDICVGGVDLVPAPVFDGVDYVALGHLHRPQTLSPRLRYSGSPMAYSFGEAGQQKLVWLVDLDAAGLADLRRPESLVSRQLRRWTRQWEASKTRELPAIDEVARVLAARMPEERETVLVHGDYRLDNAVLGEDGSVRAVLDWELCTVGDPMADVGLMIAYWDELGAAATLPDALFREPVTALPGFPDAPALAEAYADASGRELGDLGFWVALAYWKIAIIVEGVYRRWLNDPANGSGAGTLRPAVDRLASLARDALADG
jgi:aminoglycoside phosphotransferase (APT) family kinase protein